MKKVWIFVFAAMLGVAGCGKKEDATQANEATTDQPRAEATSGKKFAQVTCAKDDEHPLFPRENEWENWSEFCKGVEKHATVEVDCDKLNLSQEQVKRGEVKDSYCFEKLP